MAVRALDANGEVVPDFEGLVALYETGGTEVRFLEFLPEDEGVRVVEFTGLVRAGENVIVAEVWEPYLLGVNGAGRVRVLAGAIGTVEVFPLAGAGLIGGEPTQGFGVVVRDIFGNPMPGEEVELRVVEDRSGQVTVQTLTTGSDGTALTTPMFVQEDTREVSVGARSVRAPEVRDDRTYPVAAPRMIELVAAFGVIRAGQAVGFTIRVRKYDGSVDEEFEGVVYVSSRDQDEEGRIRIAAVPFTRADRGVRFVPDLLWFEVLGRRQAWASTSLWPGPGGREFLGPVSGVTEGITVLAGESSLLANAALGTIDPVTQLAARRAYGDAEVWDAFRNAAFDVGVEFRFAFVAEVENAEGGVDSLTLGESQVDSATDLFGRVRAHGFPLTSDLLGSVEGRVVRDSYVTLVVSVPDLIADARRRIEAVAAGIQAVRDDPETPPEALPALDAAREALVGSDGAAARLGEAEFEAGLDSVQAGADALGQAEAEGAEIGALGEELGRVADLIRRAFRRIQSPFWLDRSTGVTMGAEAPGTVVPGRSDQEVLTTLSASMRGVGPTLTGGRRLVLQASVWLLEPPGAEDPLPWRFSSAPTATIATEPSFTWDVAEAVPPDTNPNLSARGDRVE
ncbi:MAG: Ig-like domain-containing protein, partial [Planctomycetes bacterium]|nr:Ig-like domain-containing protein [Planctomycetota bacterium]